MRFITRIISIVFCAAAIALHPIEVESKAKSKARTTTTTRAKKSSKKSSSTRSKSRTKGTKSSRTRGKKTTTRRVWAPFASFETTATPSQYNVPDDSIASLRRKADAGNREAQYLLGCSYFERRVSGANRDSADYNAMRYWRMAAEQGHVTAMGDYGYCLRTGRGIQADTLAAVEMYVASLIKGNSRLERLTRQNADRKSSFDAYVLARSIDSGLKIVDKRNAAYYDEIACEGGFIPAIIDNAKRELAAGNGDGAVKLLRSIHNPDDATIDRILEMLKSAGSQDIEVLVNVASTGYPDAQLILADILIERNELKEAYQWMYKAAQNGSDTGLEKLVLMLLNQESELYEPYEAYLWIDTYADGNDEETVKYATELSGNDTSFINYVLGMQKISQEKPDYAGAHPLFRESTTAGSESMALLCDAKSVKKSQAAKELRKRAGEDRPLAAVAYSYINQKDAMGYLNTAAKRGDVASKNRLGVILYKNKKYSDAHKVLTDIQQNSILTEEAAIALSECDEKVSKLKNGN
ncbi:MAG: sel1 repeat family protein [Muribaculaceae bacterium]|nr:sel1 repeat family protein [Muribaculaceae bacterium]